MMNRVMITAVLLVLGTTVAHAQTCTPVRINLTQADAQHDTGTGITVEFEIALGAKLPQHSYIVNGTGPTIYTTADTIYLGTNAEQGYITVLNGFGGCTSAWNFVFYHIMSFYEPADHATLWSTGWVPSTPTAIQVGKVPWYNYYTTNPVPGTQGPAIPIYAGHTYQFWDCAFAQIGIVATGGNPQTPSYCRYMTIIHD
jgi:hypothetical protein